MTSDPSMSIDRVFDLCIIGAGMFGSAAARHASANPCLQVCLIGPGEPHTVEEWSRRDIHSSHYDEGRIVLATEESGALQVLAKNSMQRYRELERLSGIGFYYPVGTLHVVERSSSLLRKWMESLRMQKTPFVDLSFNDMLNKRFPYLRVDGHPFFDDSGAGYVSPRRMVEAQKRVAKAQGCTLVQEVAEQVTEEQGLHQVITESGNIVKAKRLLFCTGAFTKFKNLEPVQNLKFSVRRETAALLKISHEESQRLSSMPCIVEHKYEIPNTSSTVTGAYILPPIQYPDNHYYLKIGPIGEDDSPDILAVEESRLWYNHKGDAKLLNNLPKQLIQMLPGIKVEEFKSKTCLLSKSPSGLPYIDRVSPTVTVAVVGNGIGATICEEVGRLASELSATGRWDSELPKHLFEADFD